MEVLSEYLSLFDRLPESVLALLAGPAEGPVVQSSVVIAGDPASRSMLFNWIDGP